MDEDLRFDFAQVTAKPYRTQQGFLRVDANLTRTGVLKYTLPDGSVRRELRHPDEVFNADSLQSLAACPITDLHPTEGMVTKDNWRQLSRGVLGDVRRDGKFIAGHLTIADGDLIKKVEAKKRREVSCGYHTKLDMQSGTWEDGEAYDCIQRKIRYNHVAIGPLGWARAGSEVALRMDGMGLVSYESKIVDDPEDIYGLETSKQISPIETLVLKKLEEMGKGLGHLAEHLGVDLWMVRSFIRGSWDVMRPDSAPRTGLAKSADFKKLASFIDVDAKDLFEMVPDAERGDGTQEPIGEITMENVTIKLDGVEYEMPKAIAPHIERLVKGKDEAIKAATERADNAEAKVDTEKAKADTLAAENEQLKKDLADAKSPKRIDGMVKDRVALLANAEKVLGKEEFAKLDGKGDREIKIACVAKFDTKFDGKDEDGKDRTDAYVNARFDGIVPMIDKAGDNTDERKGAMGDVMRQTGGGNDPRTDAQEAADKARTEMGKNWQQPFGITASK